MRSVPFPVIVGVARSGTTLLRMMLDSHSDLAIPPETGFLSSASLLELRGDAGARALTNFPNDAPAWNDFGIGRLAFLNEAQKFGEDATIDQIVRLFYRMYSMQHGKKRCGDKTPLYLQHMPTVASVLPEARFVHIIRDGRDVALSWKQTWFAPTKDLAELVNLWSTMIQSGREMARGLPYLEILFADLIQEPERTLRRVCAFLELEYEPQMLDYHIRAPMRLAEHRERYDVNGKLIVSQANRIKQQILTTSRPSSDRVGVWRDQWSTEDLARISPSAQAVIGEIAEAA